MDKKVTINCLCGKKVRLELLGGQYQNTYYGNCVCGRKWSLEEQSEAIEEIADKNEL
jgi:hypothetical protein